MENAKTPEQLAEEGKRYYQQGNFPKAAEMTPPKDVLSLWRGFPNFSPSPSNSPSNVSCKCPQVIYELT